MISLKKSHANYDLGNNDLFSHWALWQNVAEVDALLKKCPQFKLLIGKKTHLDTLDVTGSKRGNLIKLERRGDLRRGCDPSWLVGYLTGASPCTLPPLLNVLRKGPQTCKNGKMSQKSTIALCEKTIEEMVLRICKPSKGFLNFSLSFTFILNS